MCIEIAFVLKILLNGHVLCTKWFSLHFARFIMFAVDLNNDTVAVICISPCWCRKLFTLVKISDRDWWPPQATILYSDTCICCKCECLLDNKTNARTVARREMANIPRHIRIVCIAPKVPMATWIPAIILSCDSGTINWKKVINTVLVFMWILFRPVLTCVSGWCYIFSAIVQMRVTCTPTNQVTWNWRDSFKCRIFVFFIWSNSTIHKLIHGCEIQLICCVLMAIVALKGCQRYSKLHQENTPI